MKNKILITGAAGFIGSHLVELLLKEEPIERLRLFIAKGESLNNLPSKKFDIITGDIRNLKIVKKAMGNVSVVYHLAAKTIDGSFYYPDLEYEEVNVKGTQNLLTECKNSRIEKFILFSSIAVFGLPAWTGDMINWDESYPKKPVEVYGRSKLEAEKAVIAANKRWGIPYAIIRPTNAYGPRDKRNLVELYKAIKNHRFFFIGKGDNRMDYVFVKDVTRAARLAQLSNRKSGDYIIGGGKPLTLNEIVKNVSQSIHTAVFPIHTPKIIGLALSNVINSMGKLAGISPPLFPSRVKVMTSNCFFNISKAKKEIGYHPQVSFERGTKITGRWLMETKSI